MIYEFEVFEYLKGDGEDELKVHLFSGPKYYAFPDWIADRSQREARELATNWEEASRDLIGQTAILTLYYTFSDDSDKGNAYRAYGKGYGIVPYPILYALWQVKDDASLYEGESESGQVKTIALADLKNKIEDMSVASAGGQVACIIKTLYWRSRVKSQFHGTYKELTIGGYREPDEFPASRVEMASGHSAKTAVFQNQSPSPNTAHFTDVWLEGRDKELFAPGFVEDSGLVTEGMYTIRPLPQGEYSVIYSRFNRSTPCGDPRVVDSSAAWDATEWILDVASPEDTIFETFFDPSARGSSIGADFDRGILDPNSDHVGADAGVSIVRAEWASGTVGMVFSGGTVPAGYHADFIALDGETVLRLAFADATEEFQDGQITLRWDVIEQPWSVGDKLMLRITGEGTLY